MTVTSTIAYHFTATITAAKSFILQAKVLSCWLKFVHDCRVHVRTHTGVNPHVCTSRGCGKSYISKQLLLKHQHRRHPGQFMSQTLHNIDDGWMGGEGRDKDREDRRTDRLD
jgi:hypothetical protein